jgi:hypothetical protein
MTVTSSSSRVRTTLHTLQLMNRNIGAENERRPDQGRRRREKQRRGNNPGTYFVAVAGGMKFLLLRKSREEPNGSTWTLFVTERSQPQERPGTRRRAGRGCRGGACGTAQQWSQSERDRYTQELATKFQPDEEMPF